MDFSSKKQTVRRAPRAGALALTAAVAVMALISGCSGEGTKLSNLKSGILAEPVVDEKLSEQDFAFPSQPPSLMRGREVFQSTCVKCHAASFWQTDKVKHDLAYTTPIDTYLLLTTGHASKLTMPTAQRRPVLPLNHPAYRVASAEGPALSRDDRWAVIFYTRYLAGAGDIKPAGTTDVASIFGGNCAVCHGKKGQGDGYLYTGKTGNHELHDAPQVHNLMPAPANFLQYNRVYNRTDAQLFKYLCEGIYPSAMPAWYGNVNVDKTTHKVTYVFDEVLLSNLVRHVRSLAYTNDLTPELPEAKMPPAGLPMIDACKPAATNRPWTAAMQNNGPNKGQTYVIPPADPITGGMVHVGGPSVVPMIHVNAGPTPSVKEGRKAE